MINQIMKFGVVGGTAFLIDFGIMVLLTEYFGLNYLISSTISFCISVVYNYLLSIFWVFRIDKDKRGKSGTFLVFVLLSVIGLLLNELLMWTGTDMLGIAYMLTKIGATAIVMIYNFITRKLFLEDRKKSDQEYGM